MARDDRMVYSSSDGDLRKARDPLLKARQAAGGRVKVKRETSGRRGKAVTTIYDVPLADDGLRELAGRLKKRCGVGAEDQLNGIVPFRSSYQIEFTDNDRASRFSANMICADVSKPFR